MGRDALLRREHMCEISRLLRFEKLIAYDVRKDKDLISRIFDSLSFQVKVLL